MFYFYTSLRGYSSGTLFENGCRELIWVSYALNGNKNKLSVAWKVPVINQRWGSIYSLFWGPESNSSTSKLKQNLSQSLIWFVANVILNNFNVPIIYPSIFSRSLSLSLSGCLFQLISYVIYPKSFKIHQPFADVLQNSLRPATLLKKRLTQVFSCEFCEIYKNIFLTEHLRRTVSKGYGPYWLIYDGGSFHIETWYGPRHERVKNCCMSYEFIKLLC